MCLVFMQILSQADSPAVVIQGVPAGSLLNNLGFYCVDEAGNPVYNGLQGKVQLSWCRGSKKVVLEDGIVCLPAMQVSRSV